MPFVIPPLVKWALAAFGGAAVVHWVVQEIRRVNAELDRVKAAPATDPATRRRCRRCGAIRSPASGG